MSVSQKKLSPSLWWLRDQPRPTVSTLAWSLEYCGESMIRPQLWIRTKNCTDCGIQRQTFSLSLHTIAFLVNAATSWDSFSHSEMKPLSHVVCLLLHDLAHFRPTLFWGIFSIVSSVLNSVRHYSYLYEVWFWGAAKTNGLKQLAQNFTAFKWPIVVVFNAFCSSNSWKEGRNKTINLKLRLYDSI